MDHDELPSSAAVADRDGPGDPERARRLLAQAVDTATTLGLGTIDRRGRTLLDALGDTRGYHGLAR